MANRHAAMLVAAPPARRTFALSERTVQTVLAAIARVRSVEEGDLRLGPGSGRILNDLDTAEAELRAQMRTAGA